MLSPQPLERSPCDPSLERDCQEEAELEFPCERDQLSEFRLFCVSPHDEADGVLDGLCGVLVSDQLPLPLYFCQPLPVFL